MIELEENFEINLLNSFTDKELVAWYWDGDPVVRWPRFTPGPAAAGHLTTRCFIFLLGSLWGFSKLIFGKYLEQCLTCWKVLRTVSQ